MRSLRRRRSRSPIQDEDRAIPPVTAIAGGFLENGPARQTEFRANGDPGRQVEIAAENLVTSDGQFNDVTTFHHGQGGHDRGRVAGNVPGPGLSVRYGQDAQANEADQGDERMISRGQVLSQWRPGARVDVG